jgi:hypothetical protein
MMVALAFQIDSWEKQTKESGETRIRNVRRLSLQSHPSSTSLTLHKDLQLIEECLPAIFKSNSLWNQFLSEMKVYHRWLGIVLYYSPVFPRSLRVLSLFSSIVTMLFVQSVTYNIADPDDGSCEACQNETRCLSLRSTLNLRESRCYWKLSNASPDQGSCHFRDIGEDMTRMFIVAIISAIVSAPLALSVQYLIVTVLSKDIYDEELAQEEKQKSHFARLQTILLQRTRVAVNCVDLVESCGKSSDEDLKNLQRELSDYYEHLLRKTGNQAEEFQGECRSSFFSNIFF